MPLRLYTDECINARVIEGLRRRRVDVVTAADEGLLGAADEQHLARATALNRTIVTCDRDFLALVHGVLARGQSYEIPSTRSAYYTPGRRVMRYTPGVTDTAYIKSMTAILPRLLSRAFKCSVTIATGSGATKTHENSSHATAANAHLRAGTDIRLARDRTVTYAPDKAKISPAETAKSVTIPIQIITGQLPCMHSLSPIPWPFHSRRRQPHPRWPTSSPQRSTPRLSDASAIRGTPAPKAKAPDPNAAAATGPKFCVNGLPETQLPRT